LQGWTQAVMQLTLRYFSVLAILVRWTVDERTYFRLEIFYKRGAAIVIDKRGDNFYSRRASCQASM